MSCNWEGNHRSGVARAMRHRLKWFIHLREISTPPALLIGYDTLYLFTTAERFSFGNLSVSCCNSGGSSNKDDNKNLWGIAKFYPHHP